MKYGAVAHSARNCAHLRWGLSGKDEGSTIWAWPKTSGRPRGAGDCLRVAAGEELNHGSRPSGGRKSRLVTGGTGGTGKATAIGLPAPGARVRITGRHPAHAEAAAESIRAAPAATSPRGHLPRQWPARPGSRGGALAGGASYGPVADGMKARSRRCSNYVAQDAHGQRRVTARYAMLCSAGATC